MTWLYYIGIKALTFHICNCRAAPVQGFVFRGGTSKILSRDACRNKFLFIHLHSVVISYNNQRTAFQLSALTDYFHKVIITYNNRMTVFLLSVRTDPVLPFSSRFLSRSFSTRIESAFLIRLLRSVFFEPAV